MGFFQVNFFSQALGFDTEVNVFIPTPNSDEILNHKKSDYLRRGVKFQTLYLLHGAFGDYTDWMRMTSIEKYAQAHKIAVVMPSASNSYYQDMFYGSAYLTYLTEELPEIVTKMFPLSTKRENTFVAGLSMGGYGAVKMAFQCPQQYAACISLSGAIDIIKVYEDVANHLMDAPAGWGFAFEDTEKIRNSEADLFQLIENCKQKNVALPKVFQSCGTEDFLYQVNLSAKEKFEKLGIDLTYEEHPGIHDWDYWDTHIQRGLDWLPLKNDAIEE